MIRHSILMVLCLIAIIYTTSNANAGNARLCGENISTSDSLYIYKDTLTAREDSTLLKQQKMKKNHVASWRQKPHSVTNAVLMSTFVPGLGQIYNRKAWKLPIIYVGSGVSIYFIVTNNTQARDCNQAIDLINSGDQTAIAGNNLASKYNVNQLVNLRKQYVKNMEVAAIALGVIYILNIVDAAVDGYMFNYNIDDDLSIKATPKAFFNPNSTSLSFENMGLGVSFTLKFK